MEIHCILSCFHTKIVLKLLVELDFTSIYLTFLFNCMGSRTIIVWTRKLVGLVGFHTSDESNQLLQPGSEKVIWFLPARKSTFLAYSQQQGKLRKFLQKYGLGSSFPLDIIIISTNHIINASFLTPVQMPYRDEQEEPSCKNPGGIRITCLFKGRV